jgi:hypothetical protein
MLTNYVFQRIHISMIWVEDLTMINPFRLLILNSHQKPCGCKRFTRNWGHLGGA